MWISLLAYVGGVRMRFCWQARCSGSWFPANCHDGWISECCSRCWNSRGKRIWDCYGSWDSCHGDGGDLSEVENLGGLYRDSRLPLIGANAPDVAQRQTLPGFDRAYDTLELSPTHCDEHLQSDECVRHLCCSLPMLAKRPIDSPQPVVEIWKRGALWWLRKIAYATPGGDIAYDACDARDAGEIVRDIQL